jgi:hypothetical protein
MNNIILQLQVEFTQKISEASADITTVGLGQAADEMKDICEEYAVRLTEAVLQASSAALDADKKQRKSDGILIHEKNVKRSVLTAIGEINYSRTYYKNKENAEMIYLLDHLIGVEKYERIDAHVSSKLVSEASSMSYAKSSRVVTGGEVSRQTVKNKLMRTCELAYEPKASERAPDELHIFADEDHVAMQNGKNNNVNLVTVTEGTKRVCKGRNKLIEPLHVQGYKITPEEHWEYVSALCNEKYDMDKVNNVYLHGDGASWIKTGVAYFANAVHVIDGYHLNAKMKKLTCGDVCEDYAHSLWHAMKEDDRNGFGRLVMDMIDELEGLATEGVFVKKVRSVREAGAYILSNWDAIQRRLHCNIPGSCTEPLISHILSERFSRNPMGWSEAGLGQLVRVRVFKENGGCVKAEHITGNPLYASKKAPREIRQYKAIVDKQQKEFLDKQWDLSIFEKQSYSMGLVTGTKRAYDALSKTRLVN